MLINHDTRCALDAVVDLVNTAPEGADQDDLADVAALRRFVERNAISDIGTLGERDLTAVRAVRTRVAEVFAAAGHEESARRTA
ncbi:ABATE domain-containing protein, partial [Streptomyces albiflaviniger]|nr:ABATE domain-containing protein [Streptomyces albiflaviniger]